MGPRSGTQVWVWGESWGSAFSELILVGSQESWRKDGRSGVKLQPAFPGRKRGQCPG